MENLSILSPPARKSTLKLLICDEIQFLAQINLNFRGFGLLYTITKDKKKMKKIFSERWQRKSLSEQSQGS